MADIKITDLAAYTDPVSTDVLPIVDVGSDLTKKVSIADLLENAGTGSAAAPSFSFDGDNDTGIYRPGANQVAITTGGTGRLFVDSSGNVTVANGALNISDTSANQRLSIVYGTPDGSVLGHRIVADGVNLHYFSRLGQNSQHIFYGNNAGSAIERMRLDSSGRLGVGTSSPNAPLEVVGSSDGDQLRINQGGQYYRIGREGAGGLLQFYGAQSGYNGYIFGGVNGERARIDSSGRLLVGTSSSSSIASAVFQGNSPFPTGGALIRLSRGSVPGSTTDDLGRLAFSELNHVNAAEVVAFRDTGTWTSGSSQPTRLVFSTTADGASSPTERMRIDSSGNVGIGYTSPSAKLEVNGHIRLQASGRIGVAGSGTTPETAIRFTDSDNITFIVGNGEKARIDSSGRLLVGTSTAYDTGLTVGGGEYFARATSSRSLTLRRDTTDGSIAEFRRDATTVGTISVTTTATAYNTSSDYRLKENVVPLTGAVDRLNQLQVHRFNFIADPDTTVDGFIAHESQAVVPECVTGTKDEVNDEGNPVYQGIDQSKLVPLLTAALQEAIAKIETLEQRLSDAGIA